MEDLVRNAADAEQVKKAEQKLKLDREQELFDLRSLLGQDNFRRFVWRVMEHCHPLKTTTDPVEIGVQSVGKYLLTEVVEADPEALFVMMREAKEYQDARSRNTSRRGRNAARAGRTADAPAGYTAGGAEARGTGGPENTAG